MQGLNTEDYKRVMKVVEQAILSTDLALYFRKKDRFLETANTGEIDWQEQEKKERECGFKVWLFWGSRSTLGLGFDLFCINVPQIFLLRFWEWFIFSLKIVIIMMLFFKNRACPRYC